MCAHTHIYTHRATWPTIILSQSHLNEEQGQLERKGVVKRQPKEQMCEGKVEQFNPLLFTHSVMALGFQADCTTNDQKELNIYKIYYSVTANANGSVTQVICKHIFRNNLYRNSLLFLLQLYKCSLCALGHTVSDGWWWSQWQPHNVVVRNRCFTNELHTYVHM